MQRCNYVNQNGVQCGQPIGHKTGHGNGLLTQTLATDVWHEYLGDTAVTLTASKLSPPFGVVWTNKSVTPRCIWQGPNARCIYEHGHTLPHK